MRHHISDRVTTHEEHVDGYGSVLVPAGTGGVVTHAWGLLWRMYAVHYDNGVEMTQPGTGLRPLNQEATR